MESAAALSRATSARLEAPNHDRRLTDQILSAFNHAYGMGAIEVAEVLRDALEKADAIGKGGRKDRRSRSVLDLADLWVAFVDARDVYNAICADGTVDKVQAEEALNRMKEAYMAWSDALTLAG